jgi:protein-S-isoprenylcysteine O-methyltransferase Ste14
MVKEKRIRMNIKLFFEAIIKFLLGVIFVGLLLFLPANSIKYWNGWLFMALLFIPMFIAGIVMMIKSPNLLKSRLDVKENEKEQKVVVALSGLMFLAGFIIAGLNYRFNWIHLPNIIIIISSIIFVISYIVYAEVLRENAFLSRTIEVQKGQKVIESGLYRIVRHPMYFATIFLFLTMPLILDSIISFLIFLAYPYIIAKRIKNEEKVLEEELEGYKDYQNKVKYKMIPFIW